MGFRIIIFQVSLLLSSLGFTKSSDILQCFTDYETELKCKLDLSQADECSENKLNALLIIHEIKRFTCQFELHHGACECTIQNPNRFFVTETFTMSVQKGDKIFGKNFTTEEIIKPRRPIISSVIPKTNGNFDITLNTTYTHKTFAESLMVELKYGIAGSNDSVIDLLQEGQTTYEILGRNLQPNSKYILKARMKSSYPPAKIFSDYSNPYEFKTPQSLRNIFIITLPILCLILIICISSVYFWFNRIVKPWWDKIPTPKFSTNFVKQVPPLMSFKLEFSRVSLDSTAKLDTKDTCMKPFQVQGEDSQDSLSVGEHADSASLVCSMTGLNHGGKDHAEDFQLEPDAQTPAEFSSGISNRTYSAADPSSSFLNAPIAHTCSWEPFQVSSKYPKIQIDLDYSMWKGNTESGNSKMIHIRPSDNDNAAKVFGYNSVGAGDALGSFNDLIMKRLLSTKKPQDVPFSVHDSMIIPVENEYQAV